MLVMLMLVNGNPGHVRIIGNVGPVHVRSMGTSVLFMLVNGNVSHGRWDRWSYSCMSQWERWSCLSHWEHWSC